MNKEKLKSALESMMFVWGEPLDYKVAAEVIEHDKKEVLACFYEMIDDYEESHRGLSIKEVNKKFSLTTKESNFEYIEKLCVPVKEKKLSQAALESLAIIAYKQPITKAEIESIRGVKSYKVIEGLSDKDFIEEKGRSPKIGRPILYGTTDLFLQKFGFSSLADLPQIEEIEEVINKDDDEVQQMMLDFGGVEVPDEQEEQEHDTVSETIEGEEPVAVEEPMM